MGYVESGVKHHQTNKQKYTYLVLFCSLKRNAKMKVKFACLKYDLLLYFRQEHGKIQQERQSLNDATFNYIMVT
jgi:hypothetical protein